MRGTEAESASNDANFLQNSARKVTDFFFISGLNFLAGIAGDLASSRGVSDPRRSGPGDEKADRNRGRSRPGCSRSASRLGRHTAPPSFSNALLKGRNSRRHMTYGVRQRATSPSTTHAMNKRSTLTADSSPSGPCPTPCPLRALDDASHAVPTNGRRWRYRCGRTWQSSLPVPRPIASISVGDNVASSTGSPRSSQARYNAPNRGAPNARTP